MTSASRSVHVRDGHESRSRFVRLIARIALAGAAGVGGFLANMPDARALAACTISWDGGAGTNAWLSAANWSPERTPNNIDHVCIPDVAPNVTVTLPSGDTSIRSLQADEAVALTGGTLAVTDAGNASELRAGLSVSNGTLTLYSPTTLSTLTQSSGTVAGTGAITITNAFTWSGGTQHGAASTTVEGAATISASNGAAAIHAGRTLTLNGSTNWTGGWLYTGLTSPSTLVNNGTMTLSGTGGLNVGYCCGGALFSNTGTIVKAGGGTSAFSAPVDNDGLVHLVGGDITFGAGSGTSTGDVAIDATRTLQLDGTNHAFGATADVTGDGTLRLNGTATLAGPIDVGTLWVSSGTNTISSAPLVDAVTVSNGTVTFNAHFTAPTLTFTGGTIQGSGNITIPDALHWSGGAMYGTGQTIVEDVATLAGSDGALGVHAGRTLRLQGVTSWTGGFIYTGQTSLSTVLNTGTITMTGTGGFNAGYCCGGGNFINQGTMIKAGGGTSMFTAGFENDGVLQLPGGNVTLSNGLSVSSGTVDIGAGRSLQFDGTGHTWDAGSTITGPGTLRINGSTTLHGEVSTPALVISGGTSTISAPLTLTALTASGGTVTFSAAVALDTLTLSGGTLQGTGDVTVADSFLWSSGTMQGTGDTIILNAASITGPDGSSGLHAGRTLRLEGTTAWTGGFIFSGQTALSTVVNTGTITLSGTGGINAAYCCGGAHVLNQGTITKTGGATSVFNVGFDNDGVITASGGNITLTSGIFTSSGTASIGAGRTLQIEGAGHIWDADSAITGSGTLRLQGNATVHGTVNVGTLSVAAGTSTIHLAPTLDALSISNGTIRFNTSFSVPTLTLSGGLLEGSVTVTTSTMHWSGGAQNGPGRTIVTETATLSAPSGSAQLQAGRILELRGETNWTGGFIYTGQGATSRLENSGTLTISGTGALNAAYCCGGATAVNSGTIRKIGSGTSFFTGVAVTNIGQIEAVAGKLEFSSLTNWNLTTKTLTGGTYVVAGQLSVHTLDIVTNAATIQLLGTDARISDQQGNSGLRSLLTNAPTGTLRLDNGATLFVQRALANAGSVAIGRDATLITVGLDQSSGSTLLEHPTSRLGGSSSAITVSGGVLGGVGTVSPKIVNAATLAPGIPRGTLGVTGDLELTSTSTLPVEWTPDRVDRVRVTGDAILDGTLEIVAPDSLPEDGDRFSILEADAITGTFATISGTELPDGLTYAISYSPTRVDVLVQRPGLTIGDVIVDEDAGTALVTVTLFPAPLETTSITWITSDGTAGSSDYQGGNGILLFTPGDSEQTIEVPLLDDTTDEVNETFSVDLDAPSTVTVVDDAAIVTINDDDLPPAVSVADASAAETDDSSGTITFTVTLAEASTLPVVVAYETENGTALADLDYTATEGIITFEPGDTSASVTVPLLADDEHESTENFIFEIDATTIADGEGTGTITDDDPPCEVLGAPVDDVLKNTVAWPMLCS